MGKYMVTVLLSAGFKNGALNPVVHSNRKRAFHLIVGSVETKIRCLAKDMGIWGLSISLNYCTKLLKSEAVKA